MDELSPNSTHVVLYQVVIGVIHTFNLSYLV